jgi:redox-sensitive bicupin YhaK (pirin superfamily)
LPPGYEQRAYRFEDKRGRFTLIASNHGRDESITVHQNVDVWAARFATGEQAAFRLKPSRQAWMQTARGSVALNGALLRAGDGAAASQEDTLEIKAVEEAEVLLFDLA